LTGPRPRTAGSGLTRDQIVAHAVRHARHHDLGSLSLRALADELGVTPMALYRHVRNKDEILEAVADKLLADAGTPTFKRSWRRFLEEIAESLRAVLTAYPEITELITRQPLTTPTAQARLTAAIEALTLAGFTRPRAVRAYAAVHTYTIGFCALEAGRRTGAMALDAVNEDDDPVAEMIRRFVGQDQFRFGLRAMLDGFAAG
jgi:TetR/AcrR family tetracycline transcriptional repressor